MLAFVSHPSMSSPQTGNGPSSSSSTSSAVKHASRKSAFRSNAFPSSSSASSTPHPTSSGASAASRSRAGVSFAYQVAPPPSRSHPTGSTSSSSRHSHQPPLSSSSSASASTTAPPPITTTAAPSSLHASASTSSWTTNSLPSSSSSSTSSTTPSVPEQPPLTSSQVPSSTSSVSYDISAYSSSDLLKLLASLLTQIASTNDALTAAASSPGASSSSSSSGQYPGSPLPATSQGSIHSPTQQRHHPPIWYTLTTASRSALATPSSTLTFHARNIPSITLEAYLLRILKYCPTTNHVFLSLLVYFDRMARLSGEIEGEYDDEEPEGDVSVHSGVVGDGSGANGEGMMEGVQEHRQDGMEVDQEAQMPHTIQTQTMNTCMRRRRSGKRSGRSFVIDSYNIHRLVIAGVTVASKFFSDVFYTNGRYAKVGGLPLHELNQLELQFLLLNDFRLVITGEEMQRYAEQLILFSRSQSNPIVLKVERSLGNAGSSRADDEAKARAAREHHDQGREWSTGRPHVNGMANPKFSVPTVFQPANRPSSAAPDLPSQQRHTHVHLPLPQAPASSSVSSSRHYQPYHSNYQPGFQRRPSQGQTQTQTPTFGASHEAQPRPHSSSSSHPTQRQGEFSRAYESDDDDSDTDSEHEDHRDDRSYHTETETETESIAGETDASGSTTSDEPTVRPPRPYAAGRRESMGSMMSSSDADSDAGGADESDAQDQDGPTSLTSSPQSYAKDDDSRGKRNGSGGDEATGTQSDGMQVDTAAA